MTIDSDRRFYLRDNGDRICVIGVRVSTINLLDARNAAEGVTESLAPAGWIKESYNHIISDFSSAIYNDLRMQTTYRKPRNVHA